MPKTQRHRKPRKPKCPRRVDPCDKTPFFKVSSETLLKIDEYLSTPLDRFHFAVVIQQSPMRNTLLDCQKPRYLFKTIRELKKKPPYKRAPTLRKAIKMTSDWLQKKGLCRECLSYSVPVHIDHARADRQPRCFTCIYLYYQCRKDRPRCYCGSDLILRKCTSDMSQRGRTYYLVLDCEKKMLCEKCPTADLVAHGFRHMFDVRERFMSKYDQDPEEFDPHLCIDHKQISFDHEYWSESVAKDAAAQWRKGVFPLHRERVV